VDFLLVNEPESFRDLLAHIADEAIIALDTEAASFHHYHDRVYLVQLSSPTVTAVIDPLLVGDLAPLGVLLANPKVEKIFHDADYDLRLLDKQHGFRARHLFDTRIAAQFLDEPGIGLGALLAKYFGVKVDKRFQRADWSARPLSAEMLRYASDDTRYLCELRTILLNQLIDIGRDSWVAEEFELLEKTRWTAGELDQQTSYLALKGARALERRALAVLRELYFWRETTAAELDRASFRVMGNETLLLLASNPVTEAAALAKVRGVGREVVSRWGGEVLAAIARGLAVPDAELPRIERAPRRAIDLEHLARVERLKGARNAAAVHLKLAPGVLCPNGTLEAIAKAEPRSGEELARVPGVRKWQVGAIGTDLLAALSDPTPAS
jgi:ribonuclease D